MKEKVPEINFLKKQREILLMQSKRLQIINNFSLIAVFSYVIFLLGFFSYIAILKLSLKNTNDDIVKEKAILADLADTKIKYFIVKNKIKEIKKISSSIYQHQNIFEKTFALIPSDVSMKGMSIKGNGEVSFSISTYDSKRIIEFFDNVNRSKSDGEIKYSYANIGGVTVDDEGLYNLGVVLGISTN